MPRIDKDTAERAARHLDEEPDDWTIIAKPGLTRAEFSEAVRKYLANPAFRTDTDDAVGIFD